MIIRKFVTALRQQDWATVAIEFLIVVAGIFVALQVDSWAQQRRDEIAAFQTLSRIHAEITTHEGGYRNAINQESFYIDHVLHLNELIKNPELAADDPARLLDALNFSTYVSLYPLPTTIFDNAIAEGALEDLNNQRLFTDVLGYYNNLEFWEPVRAGIGRYRDHWDDVTRGLIPLEVYFKHYSESGTIDSAEAVAIAKALSESREVSESLQRIYVHWDFYGLRAEAGLERALEIKAAIEAQLKQRGIEPVLAAE